MKAEKPFWMTGYPKGHPVSLEQLRAKGWAPGGYSIPCDCGHQGHGDKRCRRCLDCATKAALADPVWFDQLLPFPEGLP